MFNLWKQFQVTGSIESKLGQGRPKATRHFLKQDYLQKKPVVCVPIQPIISESRNILIRREPGTATNVRKVDHCDKEGLMIWKGITLDCRTFTNVFERDTGTVLRDIGMILESYVLLFRGAVDPNFIFIGDNARPNFFWKKLLGAVDTRRYPRAENRAGATRKTQRREDRRIVRQALVDPTVTRSTIRADVGVAIVPQTLSRYLAEENLKSKRPFRALPLTPEHRQLRLQWCQARSMWNVPD
ncbi:HTH_Tnp_Tc3_2 domain-containing protein [Trichonephila clavipes]|nr:HTH_Tnp_Tc3_2 domain-containing protein [Trichonephila clavipes]